MRYEAVCGTFYQAPAQGLTRQVDSFLANARKEVKQIDAKAIVCPHAGYMYSGQAAAYSFASVEAKLKKENTTVVMIGPNHTGMGEMISVSFDTWRTPIGKSEADLKLAGAIIKKDMLISKNEVAHLREHSLEVQLPFLQRINPKIKIVPICLGAQDFEVARRVAKAVFEACAQKEFENRNIVVLASSDFTHYESGEAAKKMDAMPLEYIRQMNSYEFEREVQERDLSICGHGAIAAAMEYAKLAGAKEGRVLKYTNSGIESCGGEEKVVSYASIAFV